jgi:exopolysaccharide production protein ExoQ
MSSEVFVHSRPMKWMLRPSYRSWVPPQTTNLPIWRTAIGWLLLFPMLYLAANGNILLGVNAASSTTEAAGGSSSSHKIAAALLSLLFLVVIVTCKAPLTKSLLSSKLVLSLPLLALCSSIWSGQPVQTFISSVLLLLFTVFAICIAAEFKFQRQVELIMMAGAVALPVSILLAMLAPSVGGSSAGWRGVFGHKQNCAAVSTLWLITALHWRSFGFHRQLLKTLYIIMCVVLIVMSQSRTGWLLAFVAILLWSVLWAAQHVRRLEVALGLTISVPIALVSAYLVITQYGSIATSVGKDATLSQRTIIWKAVLDSIALRPYLGYGFSAFWTGLNGPSQKVVLISGWGIQQAQNGYLDLWVAIGLGGVLIPALMGVVAIVISTKMILSREGQSHSRWCIVVIVSTLLYNIGESSFCLLQMVWFLFLLAFMGLQSLGRRRDAWELCPE